MAFVHISKQVSNEIIIIIIFYSLVAEFEQTLTRQNDETRLR